MKRRAMLLLALAMVCLARAAYPADSTETVEMARVLYHHCAQQPDATMRLFGNVLCNRVGKREFGDTLMQVLAGYESTALYDERSLACARKLTGGNMGYDAAPDEVVHAVRKDADQSSYADNGFWRFSGDYVFYYRT